MASSLSSQERTAADAAALGEHLQGIHQILRDSIWQQARRLPVPLTPPQLLALQILVEELRHSDKGLSLSTLSQRMGLAHSTVSGITTRLERRGLLTRTAQPSDRRFTTIELTEPVKDWLASELPSSRLRPLAAALEKADDQQRSAVLEGVAILRQLLASEDSL